MKFLKTVAPLLCVLMLICACSSGKAEPASTDGQTGVKDEAVLLDVEGTEVATLSGAEFMALPQVKQELTRTNSKGETTTGIYEGVRWDELAKAIGAEDAKTITAVASDGFQQAYTPDVLNAEGALFAVKKDGEWITEEAENGQLWFCASEDYTANYWSKFIVKLVVE